MKTFVTLLLAVMLSGTAFAQDINLDTNGYFGIGATHIDAEGGSSTGEMIYGGWATGTQDRPEAFYVELQLEQYDADLIDVTQLSLHAMPALYNGQHQQIFLDIGFNVAEFELGSETETESFVSYGLGYRIKFGQLSIRATYVIEDLTDIGDAEIDKPKKATVGIDWKF